MPYFIIFYTFDRLLNYKTKSVSIHSLNKNYLYPSPVTRAYFTQAAQVTLRLCALRKEFEALFCIDDFIN